MDFMRKRSVLVCIVIALLVGTYPGMLLTEGKIHAADPFSGLGDGTEENPYQIATVEQLNEVRNDMGAHYILTADIDLSDYDSSNPWTPLGINDPGYASTPFSGFLDGNDKTISNLVVLMPSTGSAIGLFHGIADDGHVEKLSIEAVEVRGNLKVGILAGINRGTVSEISVTGHVYGRNRTGAVIGENFGVISDSHADGFVEGYVYGSDSGGTQNQFIGGLVGYNYGSIADSSAANGVTARKNAGGLVGWNNEGATITNSSASGSVTGIENIGGLVGDNEGGTITDSHATGNVIGEDAAGGLVGQSDRNAMISNSYAEGDVRGEVYAGGLSGQNKNGSVIINSHATGMVDGDELVGGLVGRNDTGATITNGYAYGNVTGVEDVGGLVGENNTGQISHSFATGSVMGEEAVGGLVGQNDEGTISESYATGNVEGVEYVGGLTGQNRDAGEIHDSYATGHVIGDIMVGGLAGWNGFDGVISNSQASGSVTGESDVGGFVGINDLGAQIEDSHATGKVDGNEYVGGLVGANLGADILNSYSEGAVDGDEYVGGLAGVSSQYIYDITTYESTIISNHAAGNVTGKHHVGGLIGLLEDAEVAYSYASGQVVGCETVGGLVGHNDGSLISNSYAIGGVTGSVDGVNCGGATVSDSIGGLVGDNKSGEIENSYAIGFVSGGINVGGLVGLNYDEADDVYGSIINSYYDRETSEQSDANGEGKFTYEMKLKSTYIGWDFDTIWGIHTQFNDAYPYFGVSQYLLTYIGNGTDHASEQTVRSEYVPSTVVIVQDKVSDWMKRGYVFKGWNTARDGSGVGYQVGDEISSVSDILLYADWAQPAMPSLLAPVNDLLTNDSTPLISGTAESEAEVMIILDGSVAATVLAETDGSWSWIPDAPLDEGLHTVSAGVKDSTGEPASVSTENTFTVDSIAPIITLVGDASMTLKMGMPFTEPGVNITDAEADISVTITGSVDTNTPGVYQLKYNAQDSAGNAAIPATRTVEVIARPSENNSNSPSDNALLSSLIVTVDGEELTFDPVFDSHTTSYRMETTAAEVTIKATTFDAAAVATLDKAALTKGKVIALVEGDNELKVVVTAESGVTKTYTLTIHRLVRSEPVEPNPDPEALVCTFRDIEGHWAEDIICEALEAGIVEGNSETLFYPQRYITRVEFAAILLRTLGISTKAAGGELAFIDQDQIPAWAFDTISVAVDNGILQGYPDLTLRPLHTVSRSEMVVMLARALKSEFEVGDTAFADDADIPDWAKGYVHRAVERGLLNGREGNRFSPTDSATRAEVTTLLLRLWHVLDDAAIETKN